MTTEKKSKLEELQELMETARCAAKYLRKKADDCTDENRQAVLMELAETASAEYSKYFFEEDALWNELHSETSAEISAQNKKSRSNATSYYEGKIPA